VKVSIVATKQENFKYVLVTNYNRNQTESNKLAYISGFKAKPPLEDIILRADDPELDYTT